MGDLHLFCMDYLYPTKKHITLKTGNFPHIKHGLTPFG